MSTPKKPLIGCNIVRSRCTPGGMCEVKRQRKVNMGGIYSREFQDRVKAGAARVFANSASR